MEIFSTDHLPRNDRLAYWSDLICDVYVGLDCRSDRKNRFQGRISRADLGQIQVSTVTADMQDVTRSRHRLATMPSDDLLVSLQMRGTGRVIQEGRVAQLQEGDMALYDAARQYRLEFAAGFEQIVFQIPREQIAQRLPHPHVAAARRIDGTRGVGLAVSRYLSSLPAAVDACNQSENALAVHSLDLIATALADRLDRDVVNLADPGFLMLLRAKRIVDMNMRDPEFDRARLAEIMGVSARQLSRVFGRDSLSPAAYIRHARLGAIAAALADRRNTCLSLTQIAFAHGYTDMAHFSRQFRSRYAVSPSDYRIFANAK